MARDNTIRTEAPGTGADGDRAHGVADAQGRQRVSDDLPKAGEDILHNVQAVTLDPPNSMQHTPEEVTSGLTGAAGAVLVAQASPGVFLAGVASNANPVSARYLLLFNKTAAPGAGNVPEIPGVPIPPLGAAELDILARGIWRNTGMVLAVSTTQNSYTAVSADEHIITAWVVR